MDSKLLLAFNGKFIDGNGRDKHLGKLVFLLKKSEKIKDVILHIKEDENNWKDLLFQKRYDLNFEHELCELELKSYNKNIEFAIKCVDQDGVELWDNNNCNNYRFKSPNEDAILYVGNGENIQLLRSEISSNNYDDKFSFSGRVAIRKPIINENVFINYTSDNWDTQQRTILYLLDRIQLGRNSAILLPDSGIEIWEFNIPIDKQKKFEFYLQYESSGILNYDNNDGGNYKIDKNEIIVLDVKSWTFDI